MKVLIDECLPIALSKWLTGHECATVQRMGWQSYENGDLLTVLEDANFDVLLTADSKMLGQQNMAARNVAALAIPTNKLKVVQSIVPQILESLEHVKKGEFHRIVIDGPQSNWKDSRLDGVDQQGTTLVRRYRVST